MEELQWDLFSLCQAQLIPGLQKPILRGTGSVECTETSLECCPNVGHTPGAGAARGCSSGMLRAFGDLLHEEGTTLTSRILASFLLLFSSREALQMHS